MYTITWEEQVPLILDQEEKLIKQASGAEALAAKWTGERGATSQSHHAAYKMCNHCGEPSQYWRQCPLHCKPRASLRPKDDPNDDFATTALTKTQPF